MKTPPVRSPTLHPVLPPAARSAGPRGWRVPGALPYLLVALLLCGGIFGRWWRFSEVPGSPAQDLAKHVTLALNFRHAVSDGQLIPRSDTRSEVCPDLPVFQYYGFFEGLSAWPFLKLGLGGMRAVTTSIVLLRWVAFVLVYATCRQWRAGRPASALAGFAYLLSPYPISNVLARVAIAEVQAHSLLPLLFLGWAVIGRGRYARGAGVIALGVLALALSHNIFFIYGTFLLAGLGLAALPDWRLAGAVALGGLMGLLLAAPQWVPSFVSRGDLVWAFFQELKPFEYARFTSFSGLWGWPQPFRTPDGLGGEARYYFTYAWWTLPAAVGLGLAAREREHRAAAVGLLLTLGVFFLLSAPPVDFWRWLPGPFSAVQFPYRLIVFTALASALGLAVAAPRLPAVAVWGLLPVMVLSQWRVIGTSTLHPGSLSKGEPELSARFTLWEYSCRAAPVPQAELVYHTAQLRLDNRIVLPTVPGALGARPTLHLSGTNPMAEPAVVFLADAATPEIPLGGRTLVPPGEFSVTLPLDPLHFVQRVICRRLADFPTPSATAGTVAMPLTFRTAAVSREEGRDRLVRPEELLTLSNHGYTRRYRVPAGVTAPAPEDTLSGLRHVDGWLREDNLIAPGAFGPAGTEGLRLQGMNVTGEIVRLFCSRTEAPGVAVSETVEVPPGEFNVVLPRPPADLDLVRLTYAPSLAPGDPDAASVDRRRLALQVLPPRPVTPSIPPVALSTVVTPISYSRLWRVDYEGQPLVAGSDLFHRLSVRVDQPGGVLTVRYRLPAIAWVLGAAGLLLTALQPRVWRRLTLPPP